MAKQEIVFNLNKTVKVKLKPSGIAVLRGRHEELDNHVKSRGGKGLAPFEVKADEEGYTSYALWSLIETFGEYVGLGLELPFEIDIKFIVD